MGNFDGDEYLDVAVAGSNTLKIFKGNRDLTFGSVITITTAYNPQKIISGDFNRDGKPDLVLSFSGGNGSEVEIFTGQGNGNFTLIKTISNLQSYAFSAADIDGDAKQDLIINDYRNAKFQFYKGNGDGTFQEPVITNAVAIYGSELVDFNGDGKLDLISGTGSVFLGNGTGGFTFLSNAGTQGYASSVAIADFNSDNLPDAAVISGNGNPNNGTSIIINQGGRIAGVPIMQLDRPYEVDSADFNLDGRYDLVTVNAYNNSAYVYLQNAQGGFGSAIPLSVGGGFNVSPFSVTVADFNNDNKPDFAVPDAWTGKAVVFTGNGDGTFVRNIFSLSATNVSPSQIRTGDFNNDGKTDIITMNAATRDYSVLLNDGASGFNLVPGVNVNTDSIGNIVAIGDITNDGKLDLVVGRPSQGSLIYLVGSGDGTFVRMPFLINGLGSISSIILEDFDNDGNLDLAIGGADKWIISFGVGNGGFFNPVVYPFSGAINDLEYQDFDSDGIKDMVAAGSPDNTIVFYKGVGNGVFNQGVAKNVGITPYSIVAKDFNNDGKLDIGLSTLFGGRVSVAYNDTNFLPCLSANDAQIAEGNNGNSNVSFQVTLATASSQSVSVDYKTVSRTAFSGTDFVQSSGTLIFQPGVLTQTVNLAVNGDVLDEDDETFTLTLSNAVNARITDAVAVATIQDDDAQPGITVGNASVIEGDLGTSIISVPVALNGASGRKIKARISTQDVTAIANQDYQSISEKIFFAPGELNKNISILVNSDYRVEPDEMFTTNLSEPDKVTLNNNQATATIINDDIGGSVQFSVQNISVAEDGGTTQVTVSRTGGNASDVGVQYFTQSGTAQSGSDFQVTNGNLVFGANETTKTFTIPIINDAFNEDTENFSVILQNVSGGGALGSQTNIVVSIQDNDPLPALSVSNFSAVEGNSSNQTINLNLRLLAPSGRSVSVNYATQNGTAVAPEDYLPVSGTVTFAAGETSKTIQLTFVGDTTFEPDETFSIALSSPVNGVIGNGNAIITILNDDLSAARTPMDFDGDGKADIAVFRPTNGAWYLQQSASGFTGVLFGASTDKIVPADYDGDGKTDVAVYRAGTWYLQRSQLGFTGVSFGSASDIPAPADINGDGRSELIVFRPSNGYWYIYNLANNQNNSMLFGQAEDKPVIADYDGDSKADIAVFRPSNGTWYLQQSAVGFAGVAFGNSEDKPVAADYDGDGKTDLAVFRPSSGKWYLLGSQIGFREIPFGFGTDSPVPADYDGDGKADLAVFRSGTWYLQRSSAGFSGVAFGTADDKPVVGAFIQ